MLRCPVYFIGIMTLLAGPAWALEVQGVVRRVDAPQRLLVVTAGQRDRALRVPAEAKVLDAAGQELAEGLGTKELREGVRVTIVTAGDGNRRLVRAIRLGWAAAPIAAAGAVFQQDTSGLVPLIDLGKAEYQGFSGGLYPDGNNIRPAAHEAAGVARAGQVQPLDTQGKPHPEGKIVLLGIGFSNTVQAFDGFMQVARSRPERESQSAARQRGGGGHVRLFHSGPQRPQERDEVLGDRG